MPDPRRLTATLGDDAATWHVRLRRWKAEAFTRWLRGSFTDLGINTLIHPPIVLHGAGSMSIGPNVYVGPGCHLLSPPGGRLVIGDGSHIVGDASFLLTERIELEPRVLVSRGVTIIDAYHASADPSLPILSQGITDTAPVVVGEGSWLGVGATLMPGVRVGRNAIVGAGAVVNRDVPDHGVAVGVPARVLDVRSDEVGRRLATRRATLR